MDRIKQKYKTACGGVRLNDKIIVSVSLQNDLLNFKIDKFNPLKKTSKKIVQGGPSRINVKRGHQNFQTLDQG